MKRRLLFKLTLLAAISLAACLIKSGSAHAWTNNRLADDAIFDNTNSMSESQIQSFFNGFPNSCLKNYQSPEPLTWNDYGGNVSAARVIYKAAQYWGLNPQVIITTLEKEESLVSGGAGCPAWRYNSAMGYDCPDGGTCPRNPSNAGFSRQVMHGSWQLKFNKERAYGRTTWDGDDNITYYGYMTRGTFKRCGSCQAVFYDGYASIDGQTIFLETGATASLYSYTPHLGQSFPIIFERWFGPVLLSAYQWQFVSQTSDRSLSALPAGQRATLTVVAKNIGTATWQKDGGNPVRLGTYGPHDRSSPFASDGWLGPARAGVMTQTSVAPGDNATFVFVIQAPHPGSYVEKFNLVAEGFTWMNDNGQFFPITVTQPNLVATVTGGSLPDWMPVGGTTVVNLTIRNDGNTNWYSDGKFPIRLGTASPLERSSPFYSPTWVADRRPAQMTPSQVDPGESGTFSFTLKAPPQSGNYPEAFTLLAENLAWFNQTTISKTIEARPPYSWSYVSQSSYTTSSKATPLNLNSVSAGQTAWLVVRALNTGTATWSKTGSNPLRIGTSNPLERTSRFATNAWLSSSRPAVMTESTVDPGETATFEFPIQVPPGGGLHREFFNLVAENATWLNEVGQFFPITINSNYAWSWSSQAAYTSSAKTTPLNLASLTVGQTGWLVIKANNTGNATWFNSGAWPMRLGTDRPMERISRFATGAWISPRRPVVLSETSVAPGAVGTFEFPFQVPAGAGTFGESFNPLAEGITWLNDVGQFFLMTVH